jgi:CheY-like chemotaxis protein
VLLVDDEPAILRMLGRILIETGCQILTAENAEEAMAVVDSDRPPIVITDIRLPRMDGVELTSRIRDRYPHTRVMLMSAYAEPPGHAADGFISKPFDNDEVVQHVKAMMAQLIGD